MTAIGLSTDQRSNSRLIWKLFSSLSKVQIKLAFSTWFHMSMFQEFVILLVEGLMDSSYSWFKISIGLFFIT